MQKYESKLSLPYSNAFNSLMGFDVVEEQLFLIRESGILDAEYYMSQLPPEEVAQIVALGSSPLENNLIIYYINYGDERRLSPHPIFDTDYYYEKYPDVHASEITALFHFLKYGWAESRNPHPMFDTALVKNQMGESDRNPLLAYITSPPGSLNPHSMIDEKYIIDQMNEIDAEHHNAISTLLRPENDRINPCRDFDSLRYLKAYPDLRNNAPAISALYHFLRYGRSEGRWIFPVSASLKGIAKQIDEICLIEPNIVPPGTDLYELPTSFSKDHGQDIRKTLKSLLPLIESSNWEYIYLLPNLKRGGAEKVLVNFLNAQASNCGSSNIAVILTDSSDNEIENWLPQVKNVTYFDIGRYRDALLTDGGLKTLAATFRLVECKHLFILNSYVGWTLVENYGATLKQQIKLHGFAFCYDYDRENRRVGYAWTHLRDCLPYLSRVITDNYSMIGQFKSDLRLNNAEAEKFLVVKQPAPLAAVQWDDQSTSNSRGRQHKILWASRIHPQKNVGLAFEIARELPDVRFFIAGGPIAELPKSECIPANCEILGEYSDFSHLLNHRFDLFLYTSKWDGLPNVLIEAAAHGIPVVASNVGGVAEIVDSETGWIVDDYLTKDQYIAAIEDAFNNNDERLRKAKNMFRLVNTNHSWDSFCRTIERNFCGQ